MNIATSKATSLAEQRHRDYRETVLVTGGSGFLARWSTVELLRRGYVVRLTVRNIGCEPHVRAVIDRQVAVGDRLSLFEADLVADTGWSTAVKGCDYVLHVASPFPATQPKDPEELIVPARDGTLRVLDSSFAAGVRRVVVTSSSAAVRNPGGPAPPRPLTEQDWTDLANPHLSAYVRSKTTAENAAWEFARATDTLHRLTVINPGTILGPLLGTHRSNSLQVIERMLRGTPAVPRLGFSFVDVRDVAALQVAALSTPGAAGERLLATGPFLWLSEVAEILHDRLGPRARKVPRRTLPDPIARVISLFDPSLRSVIGELGQKVTYSSEKAHRLFGWSPSPIEQTIVETAQSLMHTR
jgi:dihydroflavonol-4-reductase